MISWEVIFFWVLLKLRNNALENWKKVYAIKFLIVNLAKIMSENDKLVVCNISCKAARVGI